MAIRRSGFVALLAAAAVLFCAAPAAAGERNVLGFNFPIRLCYEWEGQDNRSWLVNGLIYTDASLSNADISAALAYGRRFYQGDEAGRIFFGLYALGGYAYLEPDNARSYLGLSATAGYEWRFGMEKNLRFFIECGYAAIYGSPDGFRNEPAAQIGLGINL